jgi:DUF1680 family protein
MRFSLALLAFPGLLAAADWRDQGLLHLEKSPHAKLRPVPVRAVKIHDGFWQKRIAATVERSIPTLLELLEQHGVMDNFRRLSGKNATRRGPLYTDSDLYKWMEAAAWVLHWSDRPQLRATLAKLTEEIIRAQEPSGYLNTYYVDERVPLRFKEMQRGHELYCLGHMLQAAIALHRATGDRKLLDSGIKFTDYLIANFGPTKQPLLAGHPEIELASIELYRTTGERKYLDFAGYILAGEGQRLNLRPSDIRYMFSGIPFTSRNKFEGHAVRALYAATGAADYYIESGDPSYRKTLDILWDDLAGRKMYVTGGAGSRAQGEAFGEPYELPNLSAYTESCAAIANMLFNQRMLAITGDEKYAGVMERALYNGINSGMSLDGTLYCYRNPLASDGEKIRNEWYDTTCCPPNLQRTFAALGAYLYSASSEGVYVHLYENSELDWRLDDGTRFALRIKTGMPWQGAAEITVEPARPSEFTVFLRIPEWSLNTNVTAAGLQIPAHPGQYLPVRRKWSKGDRITIEFDMRTRMVASNPRVPENVGRVAITRGPFVYAVEQADHPNASIWDMALVKRAPVTAEWRPDLLGGVTVLRHKGAERKQSWSETPLYSDAAPADWRRVDVTLIPYFAWANRGPTPMLVWLPLN